MYTCTELFAYSLKCILPDKCKRNTHIHTQTHTHTHKAAIYDGENKLASDNDNAISANKK